MARRTGVGSSQAEADTAVVVLGTCHCRRSVGRTLTPEPMLWRPRHLGEKTCLSLSMWETHNDAEAAVPVATNWVRDNLGERVTLRSNVIGGLAFFEGVPAKV